MRQEFGDELQRFRRYRPKARFRTIWIFPFVPGAAAIRNPSHHGMA
jgi:hypothetical protein